MKYTKKNNLSVSNIRFTKESFDVLIASLKSKEKINNELEEKLRQKLKEKFKNEYLVETLKFKEFKKKRSDTNSSSSLQKKLKFEKIKENKEKLNIKKIDNNENFKYSKGNNSNYIFDRQDEDIIKQRLNGILLTNNRNIYSSNDTSRLNVIYFYTYFLNNF